MSSSGHGIACASISHESIQTPRSLETVPAHVAVGVRRTVLFPHLHININCVTLSKLPLFPIGFLIGKVAIVRGIVIGGFPVGASDEEPICQCRRHKIHRFDP